MNPKSVSLFNSFSQKFLGLSQRDPVVTKDGALEEKRRVYLDTTATSLMPEIVWRGLQDYLVQASANSHTEAHRAGRDTTIAIEDSRDAIGRLVGYDSKKDVVLFTSNGATGATNFIARALFPPELRVILKNEDCCPDTLMECITKALGEKGLKIMKQLKERHLVLATSMEHHSNLLPWMEAVGNQNMRFAEVKSDGTLNIDDFKRILDKEGERIRLVTLPGVSNVTGIINPVYDVAELAHEAGCEILVDGAQWVPHAKIEMNPKGVGRHIDYLTLSGHKMYAPGSRGALVGKIEALKARSCISDVGGGMVEYVSIDDFILKDKVTAREEPGTPNIPGSISMGLVAEAMMAIGMDEIEKREHRLTEILIKKLSAIDDVLIAGSINLKKVPRAGVVSFGVKGIHHGLVAAYLNDFYNVAVRNGCFCAQPYVKRLLDLDCDIDELYQKSVLAGDRSYIPGMVRASLGIYSTEDDIDVLVESLNDLIANREWALENYKTDKSGTFKLQSRKPLPTTFSVAGFIKEWSGK